MPQIILDEITKRWLLKHYNYPRLVYNFLFAIIEGDLDKVKLYHPNSVDKFFLKTAGRFGHKEIINYFSTESYSNYCLCGLLIGGHIELFYELLYKGNSGNHGVHSWVYYTAAKCGLLDVLQNLYQNYVPFFIVDSVLIKKAVKSGKSDVINFCKARTQQYNLFHWSDIILPAAQYGHAHIIKSYMRSRINSRDMMLDFIKNIIDHNQFDLLKNVIKNKEDFFSFGIKKIDILNAALAHAVKINSIEMAKYLVCAGAQYTISCVDEINDRLICSSNMILNTCNTELIGLFINDEKFKNELYKEWTSSDAVYDKEYVEMCVKLFGVSLNDNLQHAVTQYSNPTKYIQNFAKTGDIKWLKNVQNPYDIPYGISLVLNSMKFCIICRSVMCDCRKFIGHRLTQLIGNDAGSRSIILTILNYATNIYQK